MFETKKILCVDDSAFMRQIIINILEKMGFVSIIEAGNGEEAIKMFHLHQPDLILLDLIMPVKDGIEVLKEIGQEATVIVISSVGQDETIARAQLYGAKGYIIKPFESQDVQREIAKVFSFTA